MIDNEKNEVKYEEVKEKAEEKNQWEIGELEKDNNKNKNKEENLKMNESIKKMENINVNKQKSFHRLLCDPSRWLYKLYIFSFSCFFRIGFDFCYNQSSALQKLIEETLEIHTTQYTLIQSLNSWPNVIMSFVAGIIIDKYLGLPLGTIFLALIVTIGQSIFTYGIYIKNLYVMYFGKFIYGCGAGSLQIAQNGYLVVWFSGKTLNFIFALKLTIGKVISAISLIVTPWIHMEAKKYYIGTSLLTFILFMGVLACVVGFISSSMAAFFHRKAEKIKKKSLQEKAVDMSFYDISNFGFMFWLICGIIHFYFISFYPFISLAINFFVSNYGYTMDEASFCTSLIYIFSGIVCPITGYLVDKIGRNLLWILAGSILGVVGFFFLTFTKINPHIAVTFIAFSTAFVGGALYPIVTLVVPKKNISTAYGFMFSFQSIGMASGSYLSGFIFDYSGYFWVMFFFFSATVMTFLLTVLLFFINLWKDGSLNMTNQQKLLTFLHEKHIDSKEADIIIDEDQQTTYDDFNNNNDNNNIYKKKQ